MRQKLNLITLGVTDMARSLAFYEKGLGWKRSSASMDDLVIFPLGGMVLCLHPRHELAADATVLPEGSGFAGLTISYNAHSEQEVDEVLKQVVELGAELVKPAQKVYWGGYSGYFRDPEGHLFEVAFNPFWPLDANDNLVLPA